MAPPSSARSGAAPDRGRQNSGHALSVHARVCFERGVASATTGSWRGWSMHTRAHDKGTGMHAWLGWAGHTAGRSQARTARHRAPGTREGSKTEFAPACRGDSAAAVVSERWTSRWRLASRSGDGGTSALGKAAAARWPAQALPARVMRLCAAATHHARVHAHSPGPGVCMHACHASIMCTCDAAVRSCYTPCPCASTQPGAWRVHACTRLTLHLFL